MSDYIKYMYREYLEGRTRIKKVNEDQPLFPNTGAGLLIQKNKLTDGRSRRTENPLVSTMGSVNLPCSVRLSLHCSCCSPSRS